MTNPYASLPPRCFWRRSVERVEPFALDPVANASFSIDKTDRVATAGSCFAQHISRSLADSGFNYYVVEQAPAGLPAEAARAQNYGTYSARFGNIYTVRQLLQLFQQAYNRFSPLEQAWRRGDGRYVDPFRPQVDPDGMETEEQVAESRAAHLRAVRQMFETLDVFVFTLGLTEAWRSKVDGAVFPVAPGVAAGVFDGQQHEFVNFDVDSIRTDLKLFVDELRRVNPRCRVLITVSPVPLIATYSDAHVLPATAYSKAVLRVAAEHICGMYNDMDYFPSYEIVTCHATRYFEDDLRNVTPAGVAHVMRVFFAHYTREQQINDIAPPDPGALSFEARKSLLDIVCDEEAIEKSLV